jgi:multidrug efflux pump
VSFATIRYAQEPPIVWRRDRMPTITVRGSVYDTTQPATVAQQLAPAMNALAKSLPAEMKLAIGGGVEESAKGEETIVAIVPVMPLAMTFVLMVQLQSMHKLFLVASVAPLGLIGVVAALSVSGSPMGFVAILGVVALIGIIIRNSAILVA